MAPPVSLSVRIVLSDLALEKLIYFNKYYSIVFAASLIFQTSFKVGFHRVDSKAALIIPIFTALWCLVEIFRLRLGSFGNRCESVRARAFH